MPRQGLGQTGPPVTDLLHIVERWRRHVFAVQRHARGRQTAAGANSTVAVLAVAAAVVVVAAAVFVAGVRVTALLGALQAIVVLLGDVTTRRRRETVAQLDASATLARERVTAYALVRLLSHLLQVLEGAEDLLVEHVALLARMVGGPHVRGAPHHRHAVHLFADLDHNLRTQTWCYDEAGSSSVSLNGKLASGIRK